MPRASKLPDGRYLARCREATRLKAASNGHSAVFPQAECALSATHASFYKVGVLVWECNRAYAQANFDLVPVN